MHLFFGKKKLGRILAIILFLLFLTPTTQAAEKNYDDLFVYIGDSLMKVKSGEAASNFRKHGLVRIRMECCQNRQQTGG